MNNNINLHSLKEYFIVVGSLGIIIFSWKYLVNPAHPEVLHMYVNLIRFFAYILNIGILLSLDNRYKIFDKLYLTYVSYKYQ